MARPERILLLAGSAEARQIAIALRAQGCAVLALMSEPPRGANPMPVPFEVCPHITGDHIAQMARDRDAVVDASHGFDGELTQMGWTAAASLGVPCISFVRPAWPVGADPLWHSASDVAAAMSLIGPGSRVFSATGWASLPDYAGFPGARLLLRQTSAHDRPAPFDFVELVFGTPPFTVAQEVALFRERRIDTLIARNLGGQPSRPKLDAALALGLGVILIDRPALPVEAYVVHEVSAVLDWVAQL